MYLNTQKVGNTNLIVYTHCDSFNLWYRFVIDYLGKFLFFRLLWNLCNSAEKSSFLYLPPFPLPSWDLLTRNMHRGVERQGTLLEWCSRARDKPRRGWDKSEWSSHAPQYAVPPLTPGTAQNFFPSSAPHQSIPLLPSLDNSQLRAAAAEGEPRALMTHTHTHTTE